LTTGVSETPSRRAIFTCQPSTREGGLVSPKPPSGGGGPERKERGADVVCARDIVSHLAGRAFRRTPDERDVNALMALYAKGEAEGGFEDGVRMALEGILASPRFVFRFEEPPASARAGQAYTLRDVDLASRLSFFLWASGPDEELLRLAEQGRLSA